MAYGVREMAAVIKTIGGIVIFVVCLGICWLGMSYVPVKADESKTPVEAVPAYCTVHDIITLQEMIDECEQSLNECEGK